MTTVVTMPKLGLTMTEGKIVKWLKDDGEPVEQGQPVVVVMSKKITYEMEAPASGILRIVAQPKESRKVTEVIGFILEPGESMPEIEEVAAPPPAAVPEVEKPAASAPPAPPEEKRREVRSSPAARRLARELGVDITRVQGTGRGGRITESDVQRFYDEQSLALSEAEGRVLATPLARRMAEEEGLDLTHIRGTGPEGRITEDDVLRALQAREVPTAGLPQVIPFVGLRQAIAEAMMQSLHSMAQLTLTSQADVTALVELRDLLRQRWEERISYTDLIVKAVALALREHPILNSTLVGEEIVLHDEINIGVAVALEEGLIVPVVREVDTKSVLEIHRAVQDLAERAREDALSVDEVTGGTFTVTNLGMYGVDAFTPIINPPEVAILGVGRITEELALINGQVAARSKMALSLTIDHRVVDGAPGAAFLQTLVQFLEHPAHLSCTGSPSTGQVQG
jgi:pyruvate dehydrogenase E2 component (dihydrolipoamide acetyltransferase)